MEINAFDHIPVSFTFIQENELKHTSNLVKEWFPKESHHRFRLDDFNPIENFWSDVLCTIAQHKYKNLDDFWVWNTKCLVLDSQRALPEFGSKHVP